MNWSAVAGDEELSDIINTVDMSVSICTTFQRRDTVLSFLLLTVLLSQPKMDEAGFQSSRTLISANPCSSLRLVINSCKNTVMVIWLDLVPVNAFE